MKTTSTFDRLQQLYTFYNSDKAMGKNEEAESWKQLILLELEWIKGEGRLEGMDQVIEKFKVKS